MPPFSAENQKLQGGQFDHADRLFNSVRDTWVSAAGKSNTSDVKELIPEFYYLPEFLENRFNLDLGEKQSGEKVCLRKLRADLCTRLESSVGGKHVTSLNDAFRLVMLFCHLGLKAVPENSLGSIGKH